MEIPAGRFGFTGLQAGKYVVSVGRYGEFRIITFSIGANEKKEDIVIEVEGG